MTLGPAGRILSIVHDLALGLINTAGFTNARHRDGDGSTDICKKLAMLTGVALPESATLRKPYAGGPHLLTCDKNGSSIRRPSARQ